MKNTTLILMFLVGSIAGCASMNPFAKKQDQPEPEGGYVFVGVDLAQRALPTHGKTATTRAHVDHVYLDSGWQNRHSLETIELKDAVANDVLISSDFQVMDLNAEHIRGESVQVVRLDSPMVRPTTKEAVGGEGMDQGISAEVNFGVGLSIMLNPEKLSPLVARAARVPGRFSVIGYTDPQGVFEANLALSIERADAVAQALVEAGVHPSRVRVEGRGVSTRHADDAANRHAVVTFEIED